MAPPILDGCAAEVPRDFISSHFASERPSTAPCTCDLLAGSIPYFKVGQPGSHLFVLSGGQAFMRRPGPERLRRDAIRLKRLLPEGLGFTVFGYGPRHYVEGGLDGLADSFASILECRPGPIQLVGVSYGGLVASRLAARRPRLVSDLILVSSAASFSDEGLSRVSRQINLAAQRRYAELLAEFGGVFRRPWWNWLLRARLLARRGSLASEMNPSDEIAAYLRAGLAAGDPGPSAWLQRITARTLVIGGAHDQFFGERMAETASAIGDARLHMLPNETHMAPVERARDFRREIGEFLAGSAPHGHPPDAGSRRDRTSQKGD